jgi:tetratricopeptide (TPR) repeat protein
VGHTVGGYRIEAPIGAGGMATVFRATDASNASIALKVLNPARVLPEDVRRFTREYRALAKMDHANIVSVFEAGVHHGYPWIAMEYVAGTDLGSLIGTWERTRPTDRFKQTERIFRGLCNGLQHMHDLGLVHRDVKPSNVLIDQSGEPKLTDFGVVKGDASATHNTQLTMAGRLVGTVAFMAPELITSEGVDRRADLYGLGAILYMMLTFRRPIEASSVAGYLARHLTEVPTSVGEIDPEIPQKLERACQRLLRKDKSHRYPSAAAALQALTRPEDDEALPLRGRDEAQARWARMLMALMDGAGATLAITGTRGSGKSHLFETLVEAAHTAGTQVLAARCRNGSLREQLLASMQLPSDTPLLDLMQVIPQAPVVIAADDLDLADTIEVHQVAQVFRKAVTIEGQPLLLLFTAGDVDSQVASIVGGQATGMRAEQLSLDPLDRRAVVSILRDKRVAGPAAPLLGRRFHEAYAGQPGPIIDQFEALLEAGWLEARGEHLRPKVSLDQLRRADLPVPSTTKAELEALFRPVDRSDSEVLELLAVIDRPATEALLERCVGRPTGRSVDSLIRASILVRSADRQNEQISLAHPCAARVLRGGLTPDAARGLHRNVARALSKRRRRASVREIARHHEAAGQLGEAYKSYTLAARRAARAGTTADLLTAIESAERLEDDLGTALPLAERMLCRRWLRTLRGEAMLERRRWPDAIQAFEQAIVSADKDEDRRPRARCAAGLGRALYRLRRYEEAERYLEEAVADADSGAPERALATRSLADIVMRRGEIERAETLLNEALSTSVDMASKPAEARARRGLAHLRGLQGQLDEASSLLASADELLAGTHAYPVRAGILSRSIELANAAGRYSHALYRAEQLVELVRTHDMSDRLAESYALLAEALLALGDSDEAYDAAVQSRIYAAAHKAPPWRAGIRLARVLTDLDRVGEAAAALPATDRLPVDRVDEPAGLRAAIQARLRAAENPSGAEDLARWAWGRPAPIYAIPAGLLLRDVSLAFTAAGRVDAARSSAKAGLKAMQGPGRAGLRFELLLALDRAAPDPRVRAVIARVAEGIRTNLNSRAAVTFGQRTRNLLEG